MRVAIVGLGLMGGSLGLALAARADADVVGHDPDPEARRAAVAAGADGLIVETHPNPEHALSDAAQQLPSGSFGSFVEDIERLLAVSGKTISR